MGKLFRLSNGSLGPHPDDRGESARVRHRFYTHCCKCGICKTSSLRFTKSDNCMMCQRYKIELTRYYSKVTGESIVPWPDNVPEQYNTAEILNEVGEMCNILQSDPTFRLHNEPCKQHGHIHISNDSVGTCWQCSQMKSAQDDARLRNDPYYVASGPCGGCKEITLRDTTNRECTSCGHVPATGRNASTTDSPRQAAIAAGEKWYMPTDPCPKCNTVTLKRVDNGICQGCRPRTDNDQRETPDSIMMRENPDMVISRADAESLDMKVYRTGTTCKHGHAAWRYVSTGNCIECLRGGK